MLGLLLGLALPTRGALYEISPAIEWRTGVVVDTLIVEAPVYYFLPNYETGSHTRSPDQARIWLGKYHRQPAGVEDLTRVLFRRKVYIPFGDWNRPEVLVSATAGDHFRIRLKGETFELLTPHHRIKSRHSLKPYPMRLPTVGAPGSHCAHLLQRPGEGSAVGAWLTHYMEWKGYRARRLAKESGVALKTIEGILNDPKPNPDLATLKTLMGALDITLSSLFMFLAD